MIIPYQFNKMAAGVTVSVTNRALSGSRGVFTFLANGSCNQSCMTMQSRYLTSSKIRSMEVSSAGNALYTTVGRSASIHVFSGGTASSTVVNSDGFLNVDSGAVVLDTDLNYNGSMVLSAGASASGGNVHSGGYCTVFDNTEVMNFHVSYGGRLYGSGSCIRFNSIVVSSGANFYAVQSPGVEIRYTTIVSNASFTCSSGMTLSHTTVLSDGVLQVSSGGRCFDMFVAAGGRVSHGVWGHDEETTITGSNLYGSFYLSNGTAGNYVLAGGQSQELFYYASALSTIISSGGCQVVSFGGVAGHNTLFYSGSQLVYSSGRAEDTILSSGAYQGIDCFGTAVRTSVLSGGRLNISNFGRGSDITVDRYGSCGCASGVAVKGASVGGSISFYNGCTASGITVGSGGCCYINYACSGSDLQVASDGRLYIAQNCEFENVSHAGSSLEIYSMCKVVSLTAGSGSVYTGHYCNFTSTVLGSGCNFGGSGNCRYEFITAAESARIRMYSSCEVSNVTMGPFGSVSFGDGIHAVSLALDSGGSATFDRCSGTAVTAGSGAVIQFCSSGSGSSITLLPGGTMYFYNSCSLHTVSAGANAVLSGGYSCAVAGVTLDPGAVMDLSGYTTLTSGQIAAGAVLRLSSQCCATDLSIASGGRCSLGGHNTAARICVDSGGVLLVADGASALAVTSAAGAEITVDDGGTIEYATNEEPNE